MSDVYSFTTTLTDRYMNRVVEEASADKTILIIKEATTVNNLIAEPLGDNIYVLIKKDFFDYVADSYPNHTFLGFPLGDTVMNYESKTTHSVPDYYTFAKSGLSKERLNEVEVSLHNEINRLKNLATNRIVKVTVETI